MPLVGYSCAELKLLCDLGLLFPGRRRGVTGAGGVRALSLNSLWTRESLCSVSSEHEWDLYTSSCTRAALGLFHCHFLHCHFEEGFLSQLQG